MSIKNGKIVIYDKAPFTNDFENVIYFENEQQRREFFQNSQTLSVCYESDKFEQIDKTGNIVITGNVDKYNNACYMRFQNFENGIEYFAFVLDTIYINHNATMVVFEIDVYNTYQLEFNAKQFNGISEVSTLKPKDINGYINTVDNLQGFASGTKQVQRSFNIGLEVEFVVVVAKPSLKLSSLNGYESSFNGAYSSFKYFFFPINKNGHILPFEYNGTKYDVNGLYSIMNAIKFLTNTFNDENNTVNNVINVYYSNYVGIDYDYTDGVVKLKPTDNTNLIPVKIGERTTILNNSNNVSFNGNADGFTGNIVYGGHTLTNERIKFIANLCKKYAILPSLIIAQCYYESNFGTTSVARADNNWAGHTWAFGDVSTYNYRGSIVSRGTERPSNEGGHYIRYSSVDDFYRSHFDLLANGGYNVVGKDFENASKGLFVSGGSKYNYAAGSADEYYNTMVSVRNGINRANNNALDVLDDLITSNGLKAESKSIKFDLPIKDGIVTSHYGNRVLENGDDNFHWGIDISKGGNNVEVVAVYDGVVIEALHGYNAGYGNYVVIQHKDINHLTLYAHLDSISVSKGQNVSRGQKIGIQGNTGYSFGNHVHFEVIKGGVDVLYIKDKKTKVNPYEYLFGSVQDVGNYNQTSNIYDFSVLYVDRITDFKTKKIKIANLLKITESYLKSKFQVGSFIHKQLLNSEFCNFKLYDSYGNFFNYQPQRFKNIYKADSWEIEISGSIGMNNNTAYKILGYNHPNGQVDVHKINMLNDIMKDNITRSVPIVTDTITSYMQTHANSINATQLTFNENKQMLDKQIELSQKGVDLANRESTFNAQYMLDSANISGYMGIGGNIFGGLMNLASGNFGGVVNNVANGINSFRSMDYANQSAQFTQERNSMRVQTNTLSNIQAKQSLNQSIRSFNANLKDLGNAPSQITNLGTDVSFQNGNDLNGVYIAIEISHEEVLKRANDYFNYYGVTYPQRYYGVTVDMWNNKPKHFLYTKLSNLHIADFNINQVHLLALKSIFISGVRIWKADNFTGFIQDKGADNFE